MNGYNNTEDSLIDLSFSSGGSSEVFFRDTRTPVRSKSSTLGSKTSSEKKQIRELKETLARLRDVEHQVKVIPYLQVQISVLKEEKKALQKELTALRSSGQNASFATPLSSTAAFPRNRSHASRDIGVGCDLSKCSTCNKKSSRNLVSFGTVTDSPSLVSSSVSACDIRLVDTRDTAVNTDEADISSRISIPVAELKPFWHSQSSGTAGSSDSTGGSTSSLITEVSSFSAAVQTLCSRCDATAQTFDPRCRHETTSVTDLRPKCDMSIQMQMSSHSIATSVEETPSIDQSTQQSHLSCDFSASVVTNELITTSDVSTSVECLVSSKSCQISPSISDSSTNLIAGDLTATLHAETSTDGLRVAQSSQTESSQFSDAASQSDEVVELVPVTTQVDAQRLSRCARTQVDLFQKLELSSVGTQVDSSSSNQCIHLSRSGVHEASLGCREGNCNTAQNPLYKSTSEHLPSQCGSSQCSASEAKQDASESDENKAHSKTLVVEPVSSRETQTGCWDVVSVSCQTTANRSWSLRSPGGLSFRRSSSISSGVNSTNADLYSVSPIEVVLSDQELLQLRSFQLRLQNSSGEVHIPPLVSSRWIEMCKDSQQEAGQLQGLIRSVEKFAGASVLEVIVNFSDDFGNTALHYYMCSGNYPCVQVMVTNDLVNCDKVNSAGFSPAMMSALKSVSSPSDQAVLRLLYSKCKLNLTSIKDGNSALMIACVRNNLTVIQLLCDAGADINVQDPYESYTALMLAAESGYEDAVDILLSYPACNVSLSNSQGESAIALAVANGFKPLATKLYKFAAAQRGSAPNTPTPYRKRSQTMFQL